MNLFIDSASVTDIKEIISIFPVDGVTTNPSLISKENPASSLKLLGDIREILSDQQLLFAQVIHDDYDKLIEQAYQLVNSLGDNTVIKIPVTPNGLKAIQHLYNENYKTLATAVFTAQQTHWAAKAGATYVAPYVNRIDHHGGDGVQVVKNSLAILGNYGYNCQVLAASFKNSKQIFDCTLAGSHALTASPDLLKHSYAHLSSGTSAVQFQRDWEDTFGDMELK
ncbi:fructose-6-phosphate aldolase [Salipaludibacillus sp. CUR1]|uniref:transaldolase family protein n=1 Tax=Salipaludibacillus sp. CUR1 TaxID=2820003 RepID=UPI001E476542|nr:transaldolase family protein [Salipaludibacillus sp. CUR1]MCE7792918.1 fructose-6-phosphate aldolase [Salipaludibacillus sp. CUR1]